jgi:hypothetical protein
MRVITLQRLAAAIACVGMILPSAAMSNERTQSPVTSGIDIALADGGVFVGQIVDAQGVAQVESEVAVLYQGKEVVRTVTDERGVFAARGMRGGQYEVVAQGCVAPCRLWAAHTAPPAARPAALIVTNVDVVNGQYGSLGTPGGVLGWMQSHPLLVAGAVVTAIAIPVAIAADDDDSAS